MVEQIGIRMYDPAEAQRSGRLAGVALDVFEIRVARASNTMGDFVLEELPR